MRIALTFSLGLALLVSTMCGAQVPFETLLKNLSVYTKSHPSEKIHLHLDKPYYAIGDDIWFKAYVTDSRTSEPTTISNVLYIELINDKDSVEKQLKLLMQGGIAWADFKLDPGMNEGRYRIRAYTQWMRNAGSQFFFDKVIKIGYSVDKDATALKSQNPIDVQFFPEGGSLVDGLPSKVAVKVINPNGLGENISGKIIDNEGIEILEFETSYLGMGSFFFTPAEGKSYTASIKFKNGNTGTIPLVRSKKAGYVLNVNISDTAKINVKVLISEALLNTAPLSLLAHQNGNTVFTAQVPTVKQIANLTIPTKEFISGIFTLTLFSAENAPLAERIVFVNNGIDKIEVMAKKIKQSYAKRENVNIDLITTHLDKPAQGSFSVAITNASIIKPDLTNETNILASLLLTSDLIGNVENPNHYFLKKDITTRTQLDHLLLTQGWRRIDWKLVSNQPIPGPTIPANNYIAEKGLNISGLIKLDGKPVINEKVSLLSTTGRLFAIDTLTDANGRFNFDKLQFGENTAFTIQAINKTSKKPFDIILDLIPQQSAKRIIPIGESDTTINESIKKYLVQSNSYTKALNQTEVLNPKNVLNEVEIKGEKKNLAPNSANLNGPGVADAVFTDEDLKSTTDLKLFLYGKVAGISLVNNSIYLTRSGIELPPPLRAGVPVPMKVYIDGIERSIEDVQIQDIESLEVLKSIENSFVYGTNSGVLVITTKKASSGSINKLKQVEIVAQTNKAPNSANFNGPGNADAVFDADDLKSATSLTHYLNGRIPGFTMTNGIPRLTKNGDTMMVYIDGVVFIDGQGGIENPGEKPSLETLAITDIESIEILKSPSYTAAYGHNGANGVVLITTKTGQPNRVSFTKSPGILAITANGYSPIRQFYSPKYDANPDARLDLRTTVYWNPHLVSDKDGKANINFFNPDLVGQYRILIEGIDAYGNLARKTFTYEVK